MTTYVYAWKCPGDPVEMAKEVREAEAAFVAACEKSPGKFSMEVQRADELALGKAEEFIRIFKNAPRVYLNG